MNSNDENILLSQLLTRNLISINENKTTYNAIKLLAKNSIGALPVLNDNMELRKDLNKDLKNFNFKPVDKHSFKEG